MIHEFSYVILNEKVLNTVRLFASSCAAASGGHSRRGQATPCRICAPGACGTRRCVCLCGRLPNPSRRRAPALAPLRNDAVRSEAAALVWRTWTPPRQLFRVAGGNCLTVRFNGITHIADGIAHIADRTGVGVDLRAELRQVSADRPSRAANGEDYGDDDRDVRCPCRRRLISVVVSLIAVLGRSSSARATGDGGSLAGLAARPPEARWRPSASTPWPRRTKCETPSPHQSRSLVVGHTTLRETTRDATHSFTIDVVQHLATVFFIRLDAKVSD